MDRRLPGATNTVVDARSSRSTTWGALPDVSIPAPAAVVVDASFDALPAVHAHALTGDELLVLARGRMAPALRADLLAEGFNLVESKAGQVVVESPTTPRTSSTDRLWLLTSGTTGRPKQVGHTLRSLTTVSGDMAPRRWLCPYSPGTYAWWQVVTLSLGSPGQDLVVVDPADLDGWVPAAVEHSVTAASGTPTFWRQTIMSHGNALARVPLEQISLGGEPVDQSILDQLSDMFPQARVSWIYASSELGASVVVHDGRSGFPEEWLERDLPGRPRLSVVDGELVIASPHHGEGLGGAVRTGDAVVIQDGRVLITGRTNLDEINVGGSKVSAGIVSSVLLSHPDVAWARTRGRKAPLVGTMVVADVVLRTGETSAPETLASITRWSQERLPTYGVPRRIKLLESIPAKETLKSDV